RDGAGPSRSAPSRAPAAAWFTTTASSFRAACTSGWTTAPRARWAPATSSSARPDTTRGWSATSRWSCTTSRAPWRRRTRRPTEVRPRVTRSGERTPRPSPRGRRRPRRPAGGAPPGVFVGVPRQPGGEGARCGRDRSRARCRQLPRLPRRAAMTNVMDTTQADRALKAKHRAMWAQGDYPAVAAELIPGLGAVLVEACGVGPGDRVLDVAAGTGNAATPAALAGAEVVASDLTPELLETGRRLAEDRGARLSWETADAEALPYEDASF